MVYFVRHGESQANLDGLFAGQRNDSPLTKKGLVQAKDIAEEIKRREIKLDRIIYSPLRRTAQTTEIIAKALKLSHDQMVPDKRLEEYDMGAFTGTPIHSITSAELTSHPEAENPQEFRSRLLAAIQDAKELPGTTLIVSHAGVGRMLVAIRRGINPAHFYDIRGYSNGEVIELAWLREKAHHV